MRRGEGGLRDQAPRASSSASLAQLSFTHIWCGAADVRPAVHTRLPAIRRPEQKNRRADIYTHSAGNPLYRKPPNLAAPGVYENGKHSGPDGGGGGGGDRSGGGGRGCGGGGGVYTAPQVRCRQMWSTDRQSPSLLDYYSRQHRHILERAITSYTRGLRSRKLPPDVGGYAVAAEIRL